ncbi:MAG: amino acid adenylation domain-containing protein, partial [Algicola sp.]|nr:amino acid adenylation domain-containing protein [Algicola sp.]
MFELLKSLQHSNIRLDVNDGKLKIDAPKGAMTPALLGRLKHHKDQLVSYLSASQVKQTAISKASRGGPLPLSFAQTRLWFLDQLADGSSQYNMPGVMRFEGVFKEAVVEQAFNRIVERHEPLRTVFIDSNDGLHKGVQQHIQNDVSFSLNILDLSDLTTDQQDQKIQQAINFDASELFDLQHDLMLRSTFIRRSATTGVLLFNMHHIASDGWSMGLLVDEFKQHYQAIDNNQPSPFAPLDIQYADYAQWQRQYLEGEVLDSQLDYWRHQLADIGQVHSLGLDRPRAPVQTFNGARTVITADVTTTAALNDIALQANTTLFMVLHGAFALLLSRHSNSNDIVIGAPVANRMQKELETLIGFFVNTLVLRADCSTTGVENSRSFNDFLAHIKQVNLDAQHNQDVPFEHLVEHLKPTRSTAHSPLFQVMFSLDSKQDDKVVELADFSLWAINDDAQAVAKFELSLTVTQSPQGLSFCFDYNTDLFDGATIDKLGQRLLNLLSGIIANPQADIAQLPMLTEQEQNTLLNTFNDTGVAFCAKQSVHQWFEQQAKLTPDNIALIQDDKEQLSYQALDQKANQLAGYLQNQGVKAETLVGICARRSFDLVIGILAILKAGGAYVPLDPNYPKSRLDHMISDSGIALLLCQKGVLSQKGLIETTGLTTVYLDEPLPEIYPYNSTITTHLNSANHLAYVIYTSGSTGLPKGVLNEHGALMNLCHWHINHYGIGSDSRATHLASIGFDAAVWEIWPYLLSGGTLVLVPDQTRSNPEQLGLLMAQHRVTHSFLPTALLEMAGADIQNKATDLQVILTGGEKLNATDLLSTDKLKIVNHYGPTEAAVVSTAYTLPLNGGSTPPIGKPISNVKSYVLKDGVLVPQGCVGELYIGGASVARGYLNQPELSAASFIHNPFGQGRLYKTGDLVRQLTDGNLEFVERVDDQVKIRGFRIELGEIEQQLTLLPQVNATVVVVYEKSLVAYFTVNNTTSESQDTLSRQNKIASLRKQLHTTLPDYMVPAFFVELDVLPLTANGKVDKKNLPAPDLSQLTAQYIAPSTPTETALVEIWAGLLTLQVDQLSSSANFFESGGHSLLSVRLVGEVRARLNVELTVNDVFENPQLSTLAVCIDACINTVTSRSPVVAIARHTNQLPASFAQARLWFIDQMDGSSSQYNMPAAIRIKGRFDPKVAELAFTRVIARHEPLRTVFVKTESGVEQLIKTDFDFRFNTVDLTQETPEEQQVALLIAVNYDATTSFDLTNDLMLRSGYIQLAVDEGVLLFNMHHIASDGWSMGLLSTEFWQQYHAIQHNLPSPYAPLALQYADYALWQRDFFAGKGAGDSNGKGVLQNQLDYWQQQLSGIEPVHSLPLDRPRPQTQTFNGARQSFTAGPEVLAGLNQLALSQNATLFMVLHGAFSVLLSRHANNPDIVLGVPMANRMQKELEDIIGFFVNTLVLRADCRGNPEFTDYLANIKQVNLDAQANQDVPFEHLVERLQPTRSTAHSPLFQIMFTLNNNQVSTSQAHDLNLNPLQQAQQNAVAKFELTLGAVATDNGLNFEFEYNTDLFDHQTIETLGRHYLRLLEGIIANPHCRIGELAMLDDNEKHTALTVVNTNRQVYPKTQCIHQLFERQAELRPDNTALTLGKQQMSYQQLNQKANQLAHLLIAKGINPDDLVGLSVERSFDLVIGILAILKAGGAYVPLDPNYPQSRLDYIINDSGLKLVLTAEEICAAADHPSTNPQVNIQPNHLAYVIYTSGTTGQPKGVMVEHHNVVRLLLATGKDSTENDFGFDHHDVWTLFHSYAFDFSVWEIWGALAYGGRLVVIPAGMPQAYDEFYQLLVDEKVTIL